REGGANRGGKHQCKSNAHRNAVITRTTHGRSPNEALCVHNMPLRANLPVSVRTRLTKVGVLLVQWQGRCPRSRIGGDRLAKSRASSSAARLAMCYPGLAGGTLRA